MSRTVIKVAAAVIEKEGKLLIGQRKKSDRHGLKWEFPGGKVEAGETTMGGLARELREELGIEAVIGPEIIRYHHRYPKRATILLIFHRVDTFTGEPQSFAFEQIMWESPESLTRYDFLDGDADFVRRLAAREFSSSV